ncbi:50S ribosomal protein L10 [Chitinivibrio alkaliphilus]|uniref:Large ribosomal subunit protein uL10 n=1 Tax=Chitinivibrio alkaliphilus ACht1 TaxID=1313304 RepID=U7D9E2_9BACT|nr:50S ribosomal protein L10 [Chitinivibrio alkaliphilus]ERP31025.1 ribosomal protein L10 [Chitinivibrio alkaliphilus ACht1]
MATTKSMRTEQIQKLTEEFKSCSAFYMTRFEGVTVEEINEVRGKLRDVDGRYVVVKNTLARKALAENGVEGMDDFFKGPVGVVFATSDDASAPAKVIKKYNSDNDDKMSFIAAYYEGEVFEGNAAAKLADMPSRDELYSMLLSAMQGPVRGLACSLNGILSQFVRAVDAVREKKETEN